MEGRLRLFISFWVHLRLRHRAPGPASPATLGVFALVVGTITFHTLMMAVESKPANAMYFNSSSSSTSQCLLLLLAVLHFNTPRRSYTRKTSVSKSVRAPSAGPVLPGAALHLIITLGYLFLSLSTHSNGCIYFYIAMNKWHKKAKKRNSDN